MKLKPVFITTIAISLALTLLMRFGVGCYARLFVFIFEQIEAAYIVGVGFFIVIKWIQLTPLCYRLKWIVGLRYEWLVFAALVATAIDITVTLKAYPWLDKGEIDILGVMLSIGIIGWSGLVRLLVLQWLPDRPLALPPFVQVITQSQLTNLNLAEHPQSNARIVFQSQNNSVAEHPRSTPSDQSLLSILTKTPVSTILVGEPGTGKTMIGSSMSRQWVDDGHHVYYIDAKCDPKESSLWTDACTDRYQFDGTLIRDPNEWCRRMIEAFDDFEEFRLRYLNDGKQTICILDELPSIMAAFKSYKPDPAAALNFINRIVNTLPSRNCHILLLSQNPSCTDTIPSGTIGTLKKIILAKSGSESQLAEWSSLTMMRSVKLDTLSAAIRKSPVGRGCYYSVPGEWLPMESLIREGDYNRDTLSGGGDYQNMNQRTHAVSSTAAAFSPPPPLDSLILEYFSAANPDRPKSVKNLRDSTRLRDRASDAELIDSLDRLTASGLLIKLFNGWILPTWEQ